MFSALPKERRAAAPQRARDVAPPAAPAATIAVDIRRIWQRARHAGFDGESERVCSAAQT